MGTDLDLRPGEWAQVLSLDEIMLTLDEKGCLQGLVFMPELEQFCGKRFKVKKRVQRIMLETTKEFRQLLIPAIILEGASCDGSAHQDRSNAAPASGESSG